MSENKNYEVRFKYYHYNTGAGDNGTFTRIIPFTGFDEAQKMKDKINKAFSQIERNKTTSLTRWLCDLLDDDVLKSKATIFEITETEVD